MPQTFFQSLINGESETLAHISWKREPYGSDALIYEFLDKEQIRHMMLAYIQGLPTPFTPDSPWPWPWERMEVPFLLAVHELPYPADYFYRQLRPETVPANAHEVNIRFKPLLVSGLIFRPEQLRFDNLPSNLLKGIDQIPLSVLHPPHRPHFDYPISSLPTGHLIINDSGHVLLDASLTHDLVPEGNRVRADWKHGPLLYVSVEIWKLT